jgi:hypothetical protein
MTGDLLGHLQELLQRQLELVHQGRLPAAVELFEQTDRCVQGIARACPAVRRDGDERWPRVEQLYRELSLALTAQRAEVSAALSAIRQSRRALRAYGTPLSSP